MNGIILHSTKIYFDSKDGAVCYHIGKDPEKEIQLGLLKVGSIYRCSLFLVDLYRIQISLGSYYDFMLTLNNKRKVISICAHHIKELDNGI